MQTTEWSAQPRASGTAGRDRDRDRISDDAAAGAPPAAMPPYRSKVSVREKYHIVGFISSGTYGRVYKARSRNTATAGEFAIKKYVSAYCRAAIAERYTLLQVQAGQGGRGNPVHRHLPECMSRDGGEYALAPTA